jgi:hypothetical protein
MVRIRWLYFQLIDISAISRHKYFEIKTNCHGLSRIRSELLYVPNCLKCKVHLVLVLGCSY